jgi:hypothetical protein
VGGWVGRQTDRQIGRQIDKVRCNAVEVNELAQNSPMQSCEHGDDISVSTTEDCIYTYLGFPETSVKSPLRRTAGQLEWGGRLLSSLSLYKTSEKTYGIRTDNTSVCSVQYDSCV